MHLEVCDISASLTILHRCLLPRLPHPSPVVQQWLKTVSSWNYWEDPESAEEDRDDWHSVTKSEQPPVIKWAVCCLISPAVLCLTLSVFVSGDLRTASGPRDTQPRPRWMAFSLEEKKLYVIQVHVFQTTSISIKWAGLYCTRSEVNRSPPFCCQPSERCSENSDSHLCQILRIDSQRKSLFNPEPDICIFRKYFHLFP